MAAVAEPLLTAEAYAQLEDDGPPTELVRGKIVTLSFGFPRHGAICANIAGVLDACPAVRNSGHLLLGDTGVITERNPDTVRGADLAYYSFQRVPPGPLPWHYLSVPPELVFEVRSPPVPWSRLMAKVAEYLEAGVTAVCVVDDLNEVAQVHRKDGFSATLHGDDELTLPDILGDFRLAVRRFFE